jgi:hypothetical protein
MYIEGKEKQMNKIRKKETRKRKSSLLAFLLALSCLRWQQFGSDVGD